MNKKFGIMEYIALIRLSFRNGYKRFLINILKSDDDDSWLLSMLTIMFSFAGLAYILLLPLALFYTIINIPTFIARGGFISGLGFWISSIIKILFTAGVSFFVFFNITEFLYAVNYRKSNWYINTGVKPSELYKDAGLLGEYNVTVYLEKKLKKEFPEYEIFHNVIVPKRDGSFTEIDAVAIGEFGVYVVEAKAINGALYGSITNKELEQVIGSKQHTILNPYYQNLNHINYLTEYFYEKDFSLEFKSEEYCILDLMANVVIFAGTNYVDTSPMNLKASLHGEYFFGNYIHLKKWNTLNRELSKIDVSKMSTLLKNISNYSQDELNDLIQRRKIIQDAGELMTSYSYYVGETERIDDERAFVICREDKFYLTYYFMDDGFFRAVPEYKLIGRSKASSDFGEILKYYRELTGSSLFD